MSPRLRLALLFAALTGAALALVAAALWSARGDAPPEALWRIAVIAGFGISGLNALAWLLLDEHAARPITRLAAALRAHIHAGGPPPPNPQAARYLGDLAPAMQAAADRIAAQSAAPQGEADARTQQLEADRALLSEVLSEVPLAMMLCDTKGRLTLYDGQAAQILSRQGPARLGAALSAYFDAKDVASAFAKLRKSGLRVSQSLRGLGDGAPHAARLSPLADGAVLVTLEAGEAEALCDLVFDTKAGRARADLTTPIAELVFTVFDTETTGLLPHRDEIVQIGAVRLRGGALQSAERLDMLVNPGIPIPPSATRIHGITDAQVAGQPDIGSAARHLHLFAESTVIAAHNAPFDMAFLRRHASASGLNWDHPVLDTVLLSAAALGRREDHTLDALCNRLGIEITPARRHTAMGDAEATAACLLRLLPMLEAQGAKTLGDLLGLCEAHGRALQGL